MSSVPKPCPFCERVRESGVRLSPGETAVSFPDRFPVAAGHHLVIPRRHLSRLEDLPSTEWLDLFALVQSVAAGMAEQRDVDGLNVGVNSGQAAGQTVEHAHVHVIPRRAGDIEDPRGGVRYVLPEKADYWTGRGD